jgi:hypothetical protein
MTVQIDWLGGNCPVQAEGNVDGKPFYFRARGNHWTMGIGSDPVGSPEWDYEEQYGDEPFAAGWMTEEEARAFIDKAVTLYELCNGLTLSKTVEDAVAAMHEAGKRVKKLREREAELVKVLQRICAIVEAVPEGARIKAGLYSIAEFNKAYKLIEQHEKEPL